MPGIDGLGGGDARSPRWSSRRSAGWARGARVRRPGGDRWPASASASRSSVIPYVADQLAMARLPRATYALMVSLLPATATVIGVVVLTQVPSAAEAAGVALVIAGVALHRDAETSE